jgi:hypothetical protein
MPKPGFAIVGSVFFIAGLVGLFLWTHFEYSIDDKYAIIWASSLGLIGGFHLFLQGFGINLFSRTGDGGSGGFFSDCDGDGDGGD